MLIKAGVVAATATAALLAVSPLAFAGDYGGEDDHHERRHHDEGCDQDASADRDGRGGGGVIDLSGNDVQVPVQLCDNDVLSGVVGILSSDQRNKS